jgi:hypothetical protein
VHLDYYHELKQRNQPKLFQLLKKTYYLDGSHSLASTDTLQHVVGEGNGRGTSTITDALQQLVYCPPIGQQWVQRFLGRYPLLETKVSRQIE